jgi:oxidase EvaA
VKDAVISIVRSWANKTGVANTTEDVVGWVAERNESLYVRVEKTTLSSNDFWFYDRERGMIVNKSDIFFAIAGLAYGDVEQPVIVQNEIGYLGIICKEIGGMLHFLMQAKIEPGNINKIQISPTLQATESNFRQRHGGKKPAYFDYFANASRYDIIVDQLQSEQSSRFYRKRNRNMIIKIDEDVEVLPSHRWMTLGQIKSLMRRDNLVNMDTRTVLSCIPYSMENFTESELSELEKSFGDKALCKSIFKGDGVNHYPEIFHCSNNYKMSAAPAPTLVPLHGLKKWDMDDSGVRCAAAADFRVIYCDISIEGREVTRWFQPLFEAFGKSLFGMFVCVSEGVLQLLVRAKPEVGCMDFIELGPSVQTEPTSRDELEDPVSRLFSRKWRSGDGVLYNVVLSEEGGRFYHEQNHNVIIKIDKNELGALPDGCFWVDFRTLNMLVQVNNCLNIQLRNLLSLLEA